MDLTSGSISLGILSLAVPIIASSFFHSIQSLVDMIFVGRLGPASVAAVGMSGSVLWIVVTAFMGVNVSTVAMVSRAVGAGEEERAGHVAGQALLLTAVLSAVLGAAGYVSCPYVLDFLGAEPEVLDLGVAYLRVIFGGVFFLTAIFIIGAVFQGSGDTVTPLLLGIVTTICNVILTPVLIFGYFGMPAMGVRGSAVATVTAQSVSFLAGIAILVRGRIRIRPRHMVPDFATMWRIVAIGVPGAFQMGIRAVMDLALMTIVARFGTIIVAAYTVGLRIRMIGLFPSFGFGGAAATMVGQNLGAGRPERSQRSAWTATGMAFAVSALSATAFAVFAEPLVTLFNDNPDVVATGAVFLRVTAAALASSSIGIALARSMSGAGDTFSPMVITLITLWGLQIPAAVYLSGVKELWGVAVPFRALFERISTGSETGVWYAMVAASVLQSGITAAWFARGRWKHKRA